MVERCPWSSYDAPNPLEAARLAERVLEELATLEAEKRPQTLEEVKQWLERMREN